MKFTVVAAVLALALAVDASIIPWTAEVAGHGLAYTAVSGPAAHGAWHGAWPAAHGWHGAWGPSAVVVDSWGHDAWGHDDGQWHGDAHSHGPAVVVAAAHAPAAVVVAHGPHHEGAYLAKTRGAVHSAPLSGHANSVASINVEPAPGTV